MTEEQLKPARFACVSYSISTDKRPIVGIVELVGDRLVQEGDVRLFVDRRKFKLRPGHIYRILTNEERTKFQITGIEREGEYPDAAVAASWQMAAVAFDAAAAAERFAKEARSSDVLERSLQPLRERYWDLTQAQREAFELWLLRFLRRGL